MKTIIEECWVIKDNKKKEFLSYNKFTKYKVQDISKNLYDAIMFKNYDIAKETIEIYDLKNCKPVKVRLEVIYGK